MMRYTFFSALVFFGLLACAPTMQAQSHRFVYTKGKEVLAPDGKPFIMRGTNLGNWLVPEGYMFQVGDVNSPRMINEVFNELIGTAATRKFWKQYLDSYVTEADIHYLKSIGMNSIRVPFNYRLFTSEDYLGARDPAHGFRLLDRLLGWCRKEGLYVVLDMHAA